MYERVTNKQLHIMLAFMKKHGDLSTNIVSREYTKLRWHELKEQLNCDAECKKDRLQWAKVWSDWKGRVKKKARSLVKCNKIPDPYGNRIGLSNLEEKLIEFLGSAVFTGTNSQLNKTNESCEIIKNIDEDSIEDIQTVDDIDSDIKPEEIYDECTNTEFITVVSNQYEDGAYEQAETIIEEPEEKNIQNTPQLKNKESNGSDIRGIQIERLLKELSEMVKKVTKKQEEGSNEFDLFGKTIACQLKKLPEDVGLHAMLNIQSYLVEKRLESAKNNSTINNASTEKISRSQQLNEF